MVEDLHDLRIAVDVPAAVTPSGVEEAFRRYQAARAPLGTLDVLLYFLRILSASL